MYYSGIFILLRFIRYFIPTWNDAFVELPKLICSSNWLENYVFAMKKYGLDEVEYLTLNSCAVIVGQKLNS